MNEVNYWARRRLGRRQLLRGAGLGAAGLAGAALIGCGPDDDAPGTPTPGVGADPDGQAPSVRRGGEIITSTGLEASSLDPHLGVSGGDFVYFGTIFDYLVAGNQENVPTPELSLAENWEFPDDTTIVFNLRQGVKFHDGTDFNSEAVKWNMDRVRDPDVGATPRGGMRVVRDVETTDDHTAVFHLEDPAPALLNLLGERGGAMLSPTAVERLGEEFGSQPVGTGPFTFGEWVPGSHFIARKNADYWRQDNGEQLPYLDSVRIRIIPEAQASLSALRAGDVHIAGVAARDVDQVEGDNRLQVMTREGGIASLLSFNYRMEPTDNADLRRAVAWGVDPEAVNQAVFFGRNIVADSGMWPPVTWVYEPVPDRPRFDQDRARQFLQASGHGGGVRISTVTWGETHQQISEMYQEQLRQIGIDLDITVQDVGTATSGFFQEGRFPLYVTSWSLRPEPDWIASNVYEAESLYNPTGEYLDPALPELLRRGRTTYDIEERKEVYREVNEIVLREAFFVPMLYTRVFIGASRQVQNINMLDRGDAFWQFHYLGLEA
jgi:peptide/nickel transport system substrate-binding protein